MCVGFPQAAKRIQRYTYKYASVEIYPSHKVVDDRDDPFLTAEKTVRQTSRQRDPAALIEEARRRMNRRRTKYSRKIGGIRKAGRNRDEPEPPRARPHGWAETWP